MCLTITPETYALSLDRGATAQLSPPAWLPALRAQAGVLCASLLPLYPEEHWVSSPSQDLWELTGFFTLSVMHIRF